MQISALRHRRLFLFALPIVVLMLGIWCNSGTLASYAVTHAPPTVLEPCAYLVNPDHEHFLATYRLLSGAPREQWEESVVLRRLLYPILAFPFMKIWGFERGGFTANLALYLMFLVAFIRYVRHTIGDRAAWYGAWLLATYPGITYWAGLPYSYAIIVAASLFSFACLQRLDAAESWRHTLLPALGLGLASTGYDLLPFFGVAAVLVLSLRRRWYWSLIVLPLVLVPPIIVSAVLDAVFDVPVVNRNTAVYLVVIRSYLRQPVWDDWWPLLANVPVVAIHNFFFSNFVFIPALFALVTIVRIVRRGRPGFNRVELSVLCAVSLVFLFNNLAPPYSGLEVRGFWIARVYQPVFVAFLSYCLRMSQLDESQSAHRGLVLPRMIGATIVLNAGVVFGPLLWPSLVEPAYYNFYQHSCLGSMVSNIEAYGHRPIGFCGNR
jgi:hypothetical protein